MKTQINKIGFEIEAEMSCSLSNELSIVGEIKTDGSLYRCNSSEREKHHCDYEQLSCLEYASRVFEYSEGGLKKIDRVFEIFEKYYKMKEYHWNNTMGMHIHISFKPKIPVEIWSLQFSQYFMKRMKKEFPEAYRLRAKHNQYCVIEESKWNIAFSENRYVAINYVSALEKFGTIEFRIFPADKPMEMKNYLYFTIEAIEEFIENSDKYLDEKHKAVFEDYEEKESELTLFKQDYPDDTIEISETISTKIRIKEFGETKNILKDIKKYKKGERVDYLDTLNENYNHIGMNSDSPSSYWNMMQNEMSDYLRRAQTENIISDFQDNECGCCECDYCENLYQRRYDYCRCEECGPCEDRYQNDYHNCDCGDCRACRDRYQEDYDNCTCGDCQACSDRYDHDYENCECEECQACSDRYESDYDGCDCGECRACTDREANEEEDRRRMERYENSI